MKFETTHPDNVIRIFRNFNFRKMYFGRKWGHFHSKVSNILAKLIYFCQANIIPPYMFMDCNHVFSIEPCILTYNIALQILKMAVTFKAGGVTAPAASLYPFYESKQQIKTFIVVTDEGENKRFNGDS